MSTVRLLACCPSLRPFPTRISSSVLVPRHRTHPTYVSCVARSFLRSRFRSDGALRVTFPWTSDASLHSFFSSRPLPPSSSSSSSSSSPSSPPSSSSEISNSDHNHSAWSIPNVITSLRICATPFLGYFVWTQQYGIAAIGILLAGASDWLDGYIAKNWHQRSILGSYLDPLADKFMIMTLSVSLAASGMLSVPVACVFIGRDALLVAGTFALRLKMIPKPITLRRIFSVTDVQSFEIRPSFLSKINTLGQILVLSLGVAHGALHMAPSMLYSFLCWGVAGTTLITGAQYFWNREGLRKITLLSEQHFREKLDRMREVARDARQSVSEQVSSIKEVARETRDSMSARVSSIRRWKTRKRHSLSNFRDRNRVQ